MVTFVRPLACLAALVLVGCQTAAPRPVGAPGASGAGAAPPAGVRKTISIGVLNSVKGFSPWLVGTTGGGARSLTEIHTNGLVTRDAAGNLAPQLAARLPSLEDGTIVVLPDGRMRTTWKLRTNARWHDGAPFTADDVVFTWRVDSHSEIPTVTSPALRQMELLEAVDAETIAITWQSTFYKALELGLHDLWMVPKHLLGAAFEGDKQAFLNLPYWTTEYVQLGAFRVADFGQGELLTLERFDDYFAGRPKLARIIVQVIPDPNTLLANLQAGSVDIATELTLPIDLMAQLRDEWKQSGGGKVVQRQGNWFFLNIQHNPEFGRSRELYQDVRIRRGLYAAIDTPALREVVLPGFADTEPDTFMPRGDPRAPLVGRPFARYRYDPALALQELAAGGWRRGADGRMVSQAGETAQLSIRTVASYARDTSIVAQYWRELGIEVAEETIPGALVSERPYRATFPGLEFTAQGNGDNILGRFDGRLCPRPPRFSGAQGGCYTNPAFDSLIDRLYTTVAEREQGLALKELGEIMAAELPALPMYFAVNLAAVRKGIQALDDFEGASISSGPGHISRSAHLWDRD